MARIVVVFYSATGNVAALAESLAEGARGEGAEVRVRPVVERAPREAIEANRRWKAWVDDNPYDTTASLDDLEWADGIALGSPTRFGGAAEQLKSFLDTTGGLWAQGKLANKVGTSFTSASTGHGGLETTTVAMNMTFYHWGTLIMPLGYAADPSLMSSGNPYGASWVSRKSAAPDDDALGAARVQGARLAQVAAKLAA
ncbi:NAD(P)H:quinone oxidoreductase [Actinomycetospora termitidis]|uniref:NAD(P)H:quinone oxidoreductase n=1 Tax=Actinomycetospora termitidis TaxID=3053470 RepID=A0ABT7MAY1_9PSEU|nr:NAD(P)H:quinone oxidoreductase [Actinomycetospora sp. Odt1-22]MDL5157819.1 NAD(P)H:quinone oxidoreductase [Actinomycetospora sp. Odt1-22]